MRILLFVCIVTACNSSQVGFQQKEKTEEEITEDPTSLDRKVQSKDGEQQQTIKPVISDRPLDILLVIDSSGSMEQAHQKLSENLAPLLAKVKDSDWRIVVTSATFTDCLRAVIDKGDENTKETFAKAIEGLMYKKLSDNEQSISNCEDTVRMTTKALPKKVGDSLQYSLPLRSLGHQQQSITDELYQTRSTWCTGDVNHKSAGEDSPRAHWLRDGSLLAILLITDEDADSGDGSKSYCSNNSFPPSPTLNTGSPNCGCQANNVRSCKCIDDLWQRLAELREPRVTANIYGLLRPTPFYLGWRSDNQDDKGLFAEHGSVMAEKFEEVLGSISKNIAKQMLKSYYLGGKFHDGKTSKVVLTYKGDKEEELPRSAYRIEGRTLIFNESLPLDIKDIETIKVNYSYSQ